MPISNDMEQNAVLEGLSQAVAAQIAALHNASFWFFVQRQAIVGRMDDHLSMTAANVTRAVEALSTGDAALRAAMAPAAVLFGLSPEATLREIAAAAPEPYGDILSDGQAELVSLIRVVNDGIGESRTLLAQGIAVRQSALEQLGVHTSVGYGEDGSTVPGVRRSILLDTRS